MSFLSLINIFGELVSNIVRLAASNLAVNFIGVIQPNYDSFVVTAQNVTKTSRDLLTPLWHNARQITFPMYKERALC
ncbi:hypothetical protein [Serratia marcescens]|uniref:hypothetical protein n=1 Tax=Serratia marcescens TaxID=615 RepID=UPI000AE2054D|nr:hypothetical protein [Serratia marcescens]